MKESMGKVHITMVADEGKYDLYLPSTISAEHFYKVAEIPFYLCDREGFIDLRKEVVQYD